MTGKQVLFINDDPLIMKMTAGMRDRLKRDVNELCLKLGESPRHKIVAVPQVSDAPPEDQG